MTVISYTADLHNGRSSLEVSGSIAYFCGCSDRLLAEGSYVLGRSHRASRERAASAVRSCF